MGLYTLINGCRWSRGSYTIILLIYNWNEVMGTIATSKLSTSSQKLETIDTVVLLKPEDLIWIPDDIKFIHQIFWHLPINTTARNTAIYFWRNPFPLDCCINHLPGIHETKPNVIVYYIKETPKFKTEVLVLNLFISSYC